MYTARELTGSVPYVRLRNWGWYKNIANLGSQSPTFPLDGSPGYRREGIYQSEERCGGFWSRFWRGGSRASPGQEDRVGCTSWESQQFSDVTAAFALFHWLLCSFFLTSSSTFTHPLSVTVKRFLTESHGIAVQRYAPASLNSITHCDWHLNSKGWKRKCCWTLHRPPSKCIKVSGNASAGLSPSSVLITREFFSTTSHFPCSIFSTLSWATCSQVLKFLLK